MCVSASAGRRRCQQLYIYITIGKYMSASTGMPRPIRRLRPMYRHPRICQCVTASVSLFASPSHLHMSRFASPLKRLQPSPVLLPEVPHVLGSVGMTVLFSCKSCVNSPSVSCLCSHLYMYTCLSIWGAARWMSAQIIWSCPSWNACTSGHPPSVLSPLW